MFYKGIKMLWCEKRQITIVSHALARTKVTPTYKIYSNFVVQFFSNAVFVTGHTDGNNIGISSIMQQSICIVHCTIYSIGINIFIVRLILGCTVCDLTFGV